MPNNTVVFLLACHFTCWSFADEKWGFKRQSQQFTNKRSTRVALKPPNKVWKKKNTSRQKQNVEDHQQNSGCVPSSPPKVGILAIKNWISTCQ
jgi:D-mannonate dehydratase